MFWSGVIRGKDNNRQLLSIVSFKNQSYNYQKLHTYDNVQTATGVIAQNSKLHRKVRKEELLLSKQLKAMTRALLDLSNKNTQQSISVTYDDSIIEDTNTKTQRALLEYQTGAIDLVKYYMDTRGLTLEGATKEVQDMDARQQELGPIDMMQQDSSADPKSGYNVNNGAKSLMGANSENGRAAGMASSPISPSNPSQRV